MEKKHCFLLERKEFGETYHVAAACICFPQCRVKLKDATRGQKGLLESLEIETINEMEDVVADYSITTRLLTNQEVDADAKINKEGESKPAQEGSHSMWLFRPPFFFPHLVSVFQLDGNECATSWWQQAVPRILRD